MDGDGSPRRVVIFGDSRAEWWLAPALPGLACIPCGVPGASAAYLARRFRAMVAPLRPDVVVVQLGVNDLTWLQPGSPEAAQVVATTLSAIAAVANDACALGAQVILTTIFPLARGPAPHPAVQEAIDTVNRRLAALVTEGVLLLDSAAALAGPDGYVIPAYADDELHLSPAGYAALNQGLEPLLLPGTTRSS